MIISQSFSSEYGNNIELSSTESLLSLKLRLMEISETLNNWSIVFSPILKTKQRHTSDNYLFVAAQISEKILRNIKKWQISLTHTLKLTSKTSVTKHLS